jgi:dsRNA-specific ribonuclease
MRRFARPPPVTEEFKAFITDTLTQRVKIAERYIPKITDDDSMKKFRLAFTHPTYYIDADNTRERHEFLGDKQVNAAIAEYITVEHKDAFTSEDWLSNLFKRFVGKEVFAKFASMLGFHEHILYREYKDIIAEYDRARSAEEKVAIKKKYGYKFKEIIESRLTEKQHMSVLEDTFEAFIGVLFMVCENKIGKGGTGSLVVRRFIRSFLSELNYEPTYDYVFDATTRLKELYEKIVTNGKRWQYTKTSIKVIDTRGDVYLIDKLNYMQTNDESMTLRLYGGDGKMIIHQFQGAPTNKNKQRLISEGYDILKRMYPEEASRVKPPPKNPKQSAREPRPIEATPIPPYGLNTDI